jgi:monofunctional biosynthetic peptidoglycan transglycosylase
MKKKTTILGWIGRVLLILIGIVSIYQIWIFSHVWYWVYHNPTSSSFMQQRLAKIRDKNPNVQLRHQWVAYEKISPQLKRAVIAAEDIKFTSHQGFDWEGIQKAYEKNNQKGRVVAGGSTITQQLAKNLFLSGQRTSMRKIQEAIITLMIEKMMTKKRILEIYLNIIEWGDGVFGAEAASRHYFGVSANQVSAPQAAHLAAVIPNPRFYDYRRETNALVKRTNVIMARMNNAPIP